MNLLRFFRGEDGRDCDWLVEDLLGDEECIFTQLGWTVEQDYKHELVSISFGRDTDPVVTKFNLQNHRHRRPKSNPNGHRTYLFRAWKKKEYELLYRISQYADELHAQHRAKGELI